MQKNNDTTFDQMFEDFIQFSLAAFPKASAQSSLTKLEEELEEVSHELAHGHKDLVTEYVDCIKCLLSSMARVGITVPQLKEAFAKKLAINKAREWNYNGDGTYSHKKHQPPTPAVNITIEKLVDKIEINSLQDIEAAGEKVVGNLGEHLNKIYSNIKKHR
jgi:hypothetical protein